MKRGPGSVALACLLAWLLPGAGHFYLGRKMRAVVFAGVVLTTFSLGLAFEGRPSVVENPDVRSVPRGAPPGFFSRVTGSPFSALQVFADAGIGPLDTIGRMAIFGEVVYLLPVEDMGAEPKTSVGFELRRRTESARATYGTAYLWTAGLMNILLILDAFDLATGRKE